MAVMEEELQQKMRTNQAVKRDIKFACKRSTQHIRTKLQRKCETSVLITNTEPPTQEEN